MNHFICFIMIDETDTLKYAIGVSALQALLAEKEAEIAARNKDLADFKAQLRGHDFLIEKLKHQLAGLRRHRFGSTSEALN